MLQGDCIRCVFYHYYYYHYLCVLQRFAQGVFAMDVRDGNTQRKKTKLVQ